MRLIAHATIYLFLLLLSNSVQSQCEANVGGFYFYCSPDTPDSFFVGFTVSNVSGTFLIEDANIDILGRGKSISDNTEGKNSNYTYQGDLLNEAIEFNSAETYYFQIGPYENGETIALSMTDQNNMSCNIPIYSGTYSCQGENSDGCSQGVPFYYIDFTDVSNNYFIMGRSRVSACCDMAGGCFEFRINIGEGIAALGYELVGAQGGEIGLYNNTNLTFANDDPETACNTGLETTQSMLDPLCISESGEYIIYACKNGENVNGVAIQGIAPVNPPDLAVNQNCIIDSVVVEGASGITWSSMEDPTLANLMCLTGEKSSCEIPSFQYNAALFGDVTVCEGLEFYYRVVVTPELQECNDVLIDSVYFKVYPDFTPSISFTCAENPNEVLLEVLIDDDGLNCDHYTYEWLSDGSTSSTFTALTGGNTYQVVVGIDDPNYAIACPDTLSFTTPLELYTVNCDNLLDEELECLADLPAANNNLIQTTSLCGVEPLITFNDVGNSGAGCMSDLLIIERTYTIDFDNDLTSLDDQFTCLQTFTISDEIAPSFTRPADITIDCEVPADISLTLDVTNVMDNCGILDTSFVDNFVAGMCANTGVIERSWTILDNCGNSAIQTQFITVQDTTSPTFDLPPDLTIECDMPIDTSNTGTISSVLDNCSVADTSFTDQSISGICNNEETIERTWTVTDSCGNQSAGIQYITIIDTTPPTISNCSSEITVSCDGNTDPSSIGMPTATDNCSLVENIQITYEDDMAGGTCVSDEPILRTWMFTDECGNTSECEQRIFITDTEKPTYTPLKDTIINCEVIPDPSITGTIIDADDNCALLPITFSDEIIDGPNCNSTRIIERTWTVSDICGNDSITVQVITVQDTTLPTFTVPSDTIINCEFEALISVTGDVTDEADNCGVGQATFSDITNLNLCNGTGTINRTWRLEDNCGNVVTQTQIITVQDTTPPTFTVPPNITIDCNDSPNISNTGDVEDENDNCGVGQADFTDQTNLNGCNGTGTIVRTWVLEDACGNVTSQEQLITVEDNIAPTFTAPADIVVDCHLGIGIALTGDVLDEADNCGAGQAMFTDEVDLEGCNGTGTVIRTWTLVDACGNSYSEQQTITVQDTTPPTFTVPTDTIINCEIAPLVANTGNVTDASDLCGNVTVISSDSESLDGCNSTGTIIRTWTATDDCGNFTTAQQVITVQDTTAPMILECTPIINVSCDGSTNPEDLGLPAISDNCTPLVDISVSFQDASDGGTCSGDQPIIRTWTFTDLCGNSNQCSQQIIINDDVKPHFTPVPDTTINCEIIADPINTGDVIDATDNCALLEVRYSDEVFEDSDCIYARIIERTWIASDICGNDSIAVQIITVQDTTSPSFTVPADITIECDVVPLISITGSVDDENDNCGVGEATFSDIEDRSLCSSTGSIVRRWSLVDDCGNILTRDQIITIVDNTPPTFSVPMDTVINCGTPIDPTSTGDVSDESDNCNVDEATFSDLSNLSGCNSTGTITRTWTLLDECGNMASGQQIITVQDTSKPTFTVPLDITIECDMPADPTTTGDVMDENDNCGAGQATFSDVETLDGCNGSGTIERTWILVDNCGNTTSKLQVIVVTDNTPPNVTFPADLSIQCEDDPSDLNVTGNIIATDNCTDVMDLLVTYEDDVLLEGCGGSGEIRRLWTVEDLCGNQSSATQVISVEDVTAPEFTIPSNITITCFQDYQDLDLTGDVETIAGSCDIGLMISFDDTEFLSGCNGTGYVNRSWTVADNCGNSETEIQRIDVVDNAGPTAICNDVTVEIDMNGEASLDIDLIDGGSFDCGLIERRLSEDIFSCQSAASQSVELIITDACGNSSSCQAAITVIDNIAPEISQIEDVTIQLEQDQCEIAVEFSDPTGSDNCDFTITRIDNNGLNSGDNFFVGANIFEYEITDAFGNSQRTSFEIFIQNYPPPVWACRGQLNISLDENCEFLLRPEDLLLGGDYGCLRSYTIDVATGTPENPQIIPTSPLITGDYIGQNLIFIISDGTNNLTCWGYVLVEDKMAPVINGRRFELACDASTLPEDIGFPTEDQSGIFIEEGFYVVPNGIDNCTDALVNYNDSIVTFNCTTQYSRTIFRKWYAEDLQGLVSYGYDTINILRPLIEDLEMPLNRDGVEAPFLLCDERGSNWETLANGNPSPSSAGQVEGLKCSELVVTYKDTRLDQCEDLSCFKVIRDWEVLDWCSGEIRRHQQIIKVQDNKAPIIQALEDITISSNENCFGYTSIPAPLVEDNCSQDVEIRLLSIEAQITFEEENDLYHIDELLPGVNELIFYAEDCCGNISYDSILITVIDDSPPVAICDEHTVISLSNSYSTDSSQLDTKIWASSLDDGSHDNCNDVWFKVARMNPGECADSLEQTFNDYVEFCCLDIDNENMVIFRVFEADPGEGIIPAERMLEGGDLFGTFTDCMSTVSIQDKIAPSITPPSDITITCDAVYKEDQLDLYFGKIAIDRENIDSLYILDRACPEDPDYDGDNPQQTYLQFKGLDGFVYDACEITITEDVESEFTCGTGYIRRTFTATDLSGNTSTVSQEITIENCTPFYISDIDCDNNDPFDGVIWPCDYYSNECTSNPELDPSVTGEPIIPFEFCQLIGVQYTDKVFNKPGEGCDYIIREWRIIDNCHFDTDLDDYHEIEYRYYQELVFENTVAPEIQNCTTINAGFNEGCSARVRHEIQGADDCTPEQLLSYIHYIDYDNDGHYEDSIDNGNLDAYFDKGEHRVRWFVFDGCTNVGTCDQIINVSDQKAPTPYCYDGLSTSIDVGGEVLEFWASDFDRGSFDDCSNPIVLSFSQDTTDTLLEISCDDLDQMPLDTLVVDLWATDLAGNQDKCSTYLTVHIKPGVCEEVAFAKVSGNFYQANTDHLVNEVQVTLSGSDMNPLEYMSQSGSYEYDKVEMYRDYMVTPSKNINVLEGVTTLDLVLIQKHILGLDPLDNPFLLIAADINNDGQISASDLLDLRKVILGYKKEFKNNTSWRFVDSEYKFADPTNPWHFKEQMPIYNISKDVFQNWEGIKVGDVNGSVSPISEIHAKNRTNDDASILMKESPTSISFEIGENLISGIGFQLELDIMDKSIDFEVRSKLEGFNKSNFNVLKEGDRTKLRVSYHTTTNIFENELFQITGFDALDISQVNLSLEFENEFYKQSNSARKIKLKSAGSKESKIGLLKSTPNPFAGQTKVQYETPNNGWVQLSILNARGELVNTIREWKQKGIHEESLNLSEQAAGIYYIKLEFDGLVSSLKLINVK